MTDWPVYCGNCRRRIEACDGMVGDWMHVDTRSEYCHDGRTLADPERPADFTRRLAYKRKAG